VWFVFFDGEEALEAYGADDGLWGSRHFVAELQRRQLAGSIRAMVLLDMVGDANLNIGIPANCDDRLALQVFDAARDVGCRDFFGYRAQEILDDHAPFLAAGIPAVNIIDFDFGSAPGKNDYWHTEQDTLERVSPRSLEIVGRTALRLISRLRAERGKTPESTAGTRLP
jgi:glutaminyl-peptide cyclotransferase